MGLGFCKLSKIQEPHGKEATMVFHEINQHKINLFVSTMKQARADGRRQTVPWMQTSIFAGNDCLRLLQAIGGSLPAPTCNLPGDSFERVRVDVFNIKDVSSYQERSNWNNVTICCL